MYTKAIILSIVYQAAPPELLRSVEIYPLHGAVPIAPSPETVGTMQALPILSLYIYLRGYSLC